MFYSELHRQKNMMSMYKYLKKYQKLNFYSYKLQILQHNFCKRNITYIVQFRKLKDCTVIVVLC